MKLCAMTSDVSENSAAATIMPGPDTCACLTALCRRERASLPLRLNLDMVNKMLDPLKARVDRADHYNE